MNKIVCSLIIIIASCICDQAHAQLFQSQDKKTTVYGDSRLRFEADYNGRQRNGTPQDDRDRLRIRTRLGLRHQFDSGWMFDGRMRTGSRNSQQSPHITIHDFQNNDKGDADLGFDRWVMQHQTDNGFVWFGKHNFPFWGLDEVLWDDDVTPLGAAVSRTHQVNKNDKLTLTGGAFTLPAGLRDYSGFLVGADAIYAHKYNTDTYSMGLGYLDFIPDNTDPDADHFADGNGFRPYKLMVWNARAEWPRWGLPFVLDLEYLYNTKNYESDDPDPFTAQNYDQRHGYVYSFHVGDLDARGHWLASYSRARIEAFAINSSFGASEWARWSSPNRQARANDMRAHQFNAGYAFTDNFNLLLRVYFAEAIQTQEEGSRVRVDFNYRF